METNSGSKAPEFYAVKGVKENTIQNQYSGFMSLETSMCSSKTGSTVSLPYEEEKVQEEPYRTGSNVESIFL